jgi:hypothetical protein
MKRFHSSTLALAILFLLLSAGCSSGPELTRSEPGAPTILTTRSNPGTIELNRDLQPIQTPVVQADVKDFKSQVTEVTLEFANIPVTLPMKRVNGDTWEAELDDRVLEMMAVSGQVTKYDAKVIAKNADGKIGLSDNPVEIAIKAPQLARSSKT